MASSIIPIRIASSARSYSLPFLKIMHRNDGGLVRMFRQNLCQVSQCDPSGKLKLNRRYDALLLDVGGTLLETRSPVADTYGAIGLKYGLRVSAEDIKHGFKKAFSEPWPERLRYQGDGRPFWRHVVAKATGCESNDYFEEVYQHFSKGSAWKIPEGAYEVLTKLREAGVSLAIVSNFDNRLRPILVELNIASLFDAIVISCEVGYEKPAHEIFEIALGQLGVEASRAIHIGDDMNADKIGASAVGIDSLLWRKEIQSFHEILNLILLPDIK